MYTKPTFIYHITHVKNLPSILSNGGMHANSLMKKDGVEYVNLAHQNIQDRRSKTSVPVPPRGNLHDYVPFYFAPRSPMLYTISRGNVEGYSDGQDPVIYLVSTVQTVAKEGLDFVFTDGHGIMSFTEFFKDINDLQHIDWEIMKAAYWNDTEEDNDRKRRRQAEFLVHHSFPWNVVIGIGVMSTKRQKGVEMILEKMGYGTPVKVKSKWYY